MGEGCGCPECGVVAVGHGRRVHTIADAPCFGVAVRLLWRKRIWRCIEPACPTTTFSEVHDLVAPRARLTARAVAWATDAFAHDDTNWRCAALNSLTSSGWTSIREAGLDALAPRVAPE
jgi:transposase